MTIGSIVASTLCPPPLPMRRALVATLMWVILLGSAPAAHAEDTDDLERAAPSATISRDGPRGRWRPWSLTVAPYGFRAGVRGDVWADASNFAWRLQAVALWRLRPRLALAMGWRMFEQDWTSGSGADKEGSDLLQYGPLVGLVIDF